MLIFFIQIQQTGSKTPNKIQCIILNHQTNYLLTKLQDISNQNQLIVILLMLVYKTESYKNQISMNLSQERGHQQQREIKLEQHGNGRCLVSTIVEVKGKNVEQNLVGENEVKCTLNPTKSKERTRVKSQIWDLHQIKKIFGLYQQYGSQWKIIQSDFKDRAANSIKNRFYTVIRTMLKLLFKWNPEIKEKLPHEIPSKVILRFYEGKEEFAKFKGLGKRILKLIDFDLESKLLKKISQQNFDEILALYGCIYNSKAKSQNQGIKTSKNQAKIQRNQDDLNSNADEIQRDIESIQRDHSIKNVTIRSETCLGIDENSMLGCQSSQFQGFVFFVPFTNYYEMPIIGPCYTMI